MKLKSLVRIAAASGIVATLSACGGGIASGDSGLFRRQAAVPSQDQFERRVAADQQRAAIERIEQRGQRQRGTIWDLFENTDDPNTTIEVNKYLWNASLDILNFLPIETVDPFTGVIVTGFGTPPGGGGAYRATVYVQDPALDARSLKVSLVSRGGGQVSAETQRAVEDAILTRARQLRIQDSNL